MITFLHRISFLFAALILCLSSNAQQYHFINYNIEDGLAQSQVGDIFQDRSGYLWFATLAGGVSRFDGREFQNFSTEDGLLDNQVNVITQDKQGNIWIGGFGGLTRFNGTQFEKFPLKEEWASNNIEDIVEDKNGVLWLGTDGKGVCRFVDQEIEYLDPKLGLSTSVIWDLLIDTEDNLWVGTKYGLVRWTGSKFEEVDINYPGTLNISQLLEPKPGELWISTYGQGVFKYTSRGTINLKKQDGLISNYIRSMEVDYTGQIWFLAKRGISRYDGKSFFSLRAKDGLIGELKCVTEDKEGNLWLGTNGNGVLKFTGESFVSYSTADGMFSNIVMSIIEDDGGLWFSTFDNGLNYFDGEKHHSYTTRNGLAHKRVWTSLKDSKGGLWFGTSGGLCFYKDNSFITFTEADGLNSNKVTSLAEDRKGLIWVGTKNGICTYDGSGFVELKQFTGKNVRSITEDVSGRLWFGSSEGLFSYDGISFTRYTTTDGLSDNTVYTIKEDRSQNLWLATANGLTRYDGKEFNIIKVDKGYASNFVNFILFDDEENLWIGTNNGIYTLDVPAYNLDASLNFDHYSYWEGIKSPECNLNAAYIDKEGKLWFGTNGAVVRYDPELTNGLVTNAEPFVNITSVKLFLAETDWDKYASGTDKLTGLPVNLELKYNKNHITIDYNGISHSNPKAVRYQYMLLGFDEDWLPVTEAGFATYSNLPWGEYKFLVKASNKDGIWSSEPASFSFIIAPPYWMSWWFITLSALVLGVTVYVIYIWRSRVIRRKIETQRLIHNSKMLVLEQQALNASMNRHFIFNALNSIQYYINKEDKKSANDYLANFAKLIRRNLDDSENNMVSLAEEIERLELYLSLEHMRFSDKFDYSIELDSDIDAESIQIPSMLLQPFIENSIWHGILPSEKSGEVTLKIVKNDKDDLIFTVEDNGIGIETSIKNKAIDAEDHISKGMNITKGRIDLMRKMTNRNIAIQGPFELRDSNNKPNGTRVEITLPLNLN